MSRNDKHSAWKNTVRFKEHKNAPLSAMHPRGPNASKWRDFVRASTTSKVQCASLIADVNCCAIGDFKA